MEFRILGPLEIRDRGDVVPLGGSKQRALLAMLLLHPNEVVSSDRLIESLWGDDPPETALKALQVHVSQLRKALSATGRADAVIATRPPGYVLETDPEQIDFHRFELAVSGGREALAAGDPATAASRLREALSLWHGPPLADLTYESFAAAEIGRLEELRLGALEDAIDAELRLGQGSELVGELEAVTAENPFRERLRAQLMLALYRAGRQAEALDAYREARQAFVDELGIEPGPALRALHQRILEQDPALEAAALAPSAAAEEHEAVVEAHARGAFVGRGHELAQLLEGLRESLSGEGRLFLVSGEPGIGKSRLAVELAARAAEQGARVLMGRCWEAGGAPAYWPWAQSLRPYVRALDASELREQLGAGASEVAEVVPEIRERFPDLPVPSGLESEGARFRLFDATAQFLGKAASAEPLAIVLEDVHAADVPSLLLLRFVVRELAESAVLIVVTYRDVDLESSGPLLQAVEELKREQATRELALSGLAEDDLATLVELVAGFRPSRRAIAAIHSETEGNPLFAEQIVRLLVAEGRLEEVGVGEAWTPVVPQGVRQVIGRRLDRLSAECVRALTLASVIGREFGLQTLERLGELPGDELLALLDEALAARVVAEVPGALNRLAFSHALVRDTLYDELSALRRRDLHGRVGEVLESIYGDQAEHHLAELAHHFFSARDADRAVDYSRRAGARAIEQLAFEEAARLYEMALAALDLKQPPDEPLRCELLIAAGEALGRAGEAAAARETLLRAADLAKRLGLHEQLARAALGYGGRFVFSRAGVDRYAVLLLEEALSALGPGDSVLRAKALARLGGLLRDRPEREPRVSYSREAVEIARRLGDAATLAYALNGHYSAIWAPDTPEERLAIATELTRLAEEIGDNERAVEGETFRLLALVELGTAAPPGTEREIRRRRAAGLKQPTLLWAVKLIEAMLALYEGCFDDAEQLIQDAFELGRRSHPEEALMSFRLQTFALRRARGGLAELEETVTRTLAEYPWYPMWLPLLALLHAETGQREAARHELEQLAAEDFETLPFDNNWLFAMTIVVDACWLLGEGRWAHPIYRLIAPYAMRNAICAELCTASMSRSLGQLATLLGQWKTAAAHFDAALEMNARMGARPWVALTQRDYAEMLVRGGDETQGKRSRELRDAAARTFEELGMEGPLEHLAAAARPSESSP